MYNVCLNLLLGALLLGTPEQDDGQAFKPGPQTVLVFENHAGEKETRFVVRLARFRPDIVLEWENLTDQGTVHLFSDAVQRARGFTLSRLFSVGVDTESPDVMTLWMPREAFAKLRGKRSVKFKYNRLPMKLEKTGEELYTLKLDRRDLTIPVITARDDRGGNWKVWDDPDNPLLVAYESRYFRQRLASVTSDFQLELRWIKKAPPVR